MPGLNLKTVSFSLFGLPDPTHWKVIPAALRAHATLYRGWRFKISHDGLVVRHPYWRVLQRLEETTDWLELQPRAETRPQMGYGMLWRMMPIWDPNVEWVLCRDIDSIATPRERQAVEIFMQSGAAAHCISDNPVHQMPMMGGMIGFHTDRFLACTGIETFEAMMLHSGDIDRHGADQIVLNLRVWPWIVTHTCEHRTAGISPDPRAHCSYTKIEAVPLSSVPDVVMAEGDKFVRCIGDRVHDAIPAMQFYARHGPRRQMNEIMIAERAFGLKLPLVE